VTITLPRSLADQLVQHAREGKPDEVCGIVGLDGERVVRLERARNVAETPQVRFEVDSRDLVKVVDLDREGLEVGFYHSHPASQAYPSRTDIAFARFWPGALQLMVSLRHDPAPGPELHAYRIEGDAVTEEHLVVEDAGTAPSASTPQARNEEPRARNQR
jgi:proteasome lid subunit RPN8/RPN11